jgi:deoxyadenosine/deoxycytidine kinase
MSRKLFLALAGNIGAGKTTAAKMISQQFGYELFDEPVLDNRFLKNYYGDMSRWSFTLQLEFLIRRVEHHEIIHKVQKNCVQDRTLLEDPEVFAKYLHGLGHMTNSELELYLEYFERLNRGLQQPDKILFLSVDSAQALQNRIRTRGRPEEQGIPVDFLKGLGGYYTSLPSICRTKYKVETMEIDVSKIDIRDPDRDEFLDLVSKFLSA